MPLLRQTLSCWTLRSEQLLPQHTIVECMAVAVEESLLTSNLQFGCMLVEKAAHGFINYHLQQKCQIPKHPTSLACSLTVWLQSQQIHLLLGLRYLATALAAGDSSARERLERVVRVLVTDSCVSFQDCIKWARKLFEVPLQPQNI